MSELRRRIGKNKIAEDVLEAEHNKEVVSSDDRNENSTIPGDISPESFWLTRIVFLRYLGFIYLIAFIISFNQNKELLGSHGLTPASNFLLNGKGTDLNLAPTGAQLHSVCVSFPSS